MKPYVGVTGFKTREGIEKAAKSFKENSFDKGSHLAMFGFLVSYKGMQQPWKAGRTAPAASMVSELASHVPKWGLAMMHYHTPHYDYMHLGVKRLFKKFGDMYGQGICSAVQLNVDWPRINQLDLIKNDFPQMQIVLQFPKRATKGMTMDDILGRAKSYDEFVDYALIDPSGGKGKEFEISEGIDFMNRLYDVMPTTVIGIAGGFFGDNVEARVRKIRADYPADFCIDAEGKLMEDRKLVAEKVEGYIKNARKGL